MRKSMRGYLLVVPAYNEAAHMATLLDSLVNQTVPPARIVVVDDGSTDGTAQVVRAFQADHPTVALVRNDKKEPRSSGSKVVRAVERGLATADLSDYAYVGKVDADLEFPPAYFESLLDAMENDAALGLVGGVCAIPDADGAWEIEKLAKSDHVRGALKFYRVQAFREMGGLDAVMGWDTLDEFKLRYHGWKVRTRPDLVVKHFRPTNLVSDWKSIERKHGTMFYQHRYGLVLSFLSCLKRGLKHKPYLLSGLVAFLAYLRARSEKKPRAISPELGAFIRRYRFRSMFGSNP